MTDEQPFFTLGVVALSIKRNSVLYMIDLDTNAESAMDWLIPEKQYEYVIRKRREMYEQDPMKWSHCYSELSGLLNYNTCEGVCI